ncbi:unnamed protein product [Caenorhabditis nigoni]
MGISRIQDIEQFTHFKSIGIKLPVFGDVEYERILEVMTENRNFIERISICHTIEIKLQLKLMLKLWMVSTSCELQPIIPGSFLGYKLQKINNSPSKSV